MKKFVLNCDNVDISQATDKLNKGEPLDCFEAYFFISEVEFEIYLNEDSKYVIVDTQEVIFDDEQYDNLQDIVERLDRFLIDYGFKENKHNEKVELLDMQDVSNLIFSRVITQDKGTISVKGLQSDRLVKLSNIIESPDINFGKPKNGGVTFDIGRFLQSYINRCVNEQYSYEDVNFDVFFKDRYVQVQRGDL